jgi:hypothetical protein
MVAWMSLSSNRDSNVTWTPENVGEKLDPRKRIAFYGLNSQQECKSHVELERYHFSIESYANGPYENDGILKVWYCLFNHSNLTG